jgi:threonyl-tRNA synthetase
VLGEAMERVYGGHLCYGPPIEQGFYYDMYSDEYKVSSLVLYSDEYKVSSVVFFVFPQFSHG